MYIICYNGAENKNRTCLRITTAGLEIQCPPIGHLRMKICTICNKEFKQKPNTSGLYCSISCGNKGRIIMNEVKIQYELNPAKCKQCKNILVYNQRNNPFCSHSCSASFNNKIRNVPKYVIKNPHIRIKKFCKVSFCKICFSVIPNKHNKTCSKQCCNKLISLLNKGKTGGSTKQYIEFVDSFNNKVSLDSSWEHKLALDLNKNDIKWIRPKGFILKDRRKYTPDFYLTDLKIYLDPKAYRKGYINQCEKIKMFEYEYNTRCIVISNEKLLTWNHIQTLL